MRRRIEYPYTDLRGRTLLRKVRLEITPEPTDEVPWPATTKRFFMDARRREDYAWTSPKGLRRKYPEAGPYFDSLLYGLPGLREAMQDSGDYTLVLSEGEKDADTVRDLYPFGVVALSHWQGGSGPTLTQADRLSGWRGGVVVCADVDEAGAVVAFRWYGLLREIGIPSGQIRVTRPAGPLVEGRDLTDHLRDGYGLDDLVPMDLHKLARYCARIERQTSPHRRRGSGAPSPVVHGRSATHRPERRAVLLPARLSTKQGGPGLGRSSALPSTVQRPPKTRSGHV